MPQPDFLAIVQPPGDAGCPFSAALTAETAWRRVAGAGPISIWSSCGRDLEVRPLPRDAGFVVGRLFERDGAPACAPLLQDALDHLGDPVRMARRLLRTHWGRYVALLQGDRGLSVLRDPSGELDCLTWTTREGPHIVASDMGGLPGWLRPPRIALDWDRIATFLASPASAGAASLFDGVLALSPGALAPVGDAGPEVLAWRPSGFVTEPDVPADELAAELVQRVDSAAAAVTAPYRRLIVELSGGLDSAIVAGALARSGRDHCVAQWVNHVGDRPESDERRFARAVTDRIDADLTVASMPLIPLTEADFTELAASTWPAAAAVEPWRDRDLAARLRETGADAIVSGQGGDALFFQMPSAWIACGEVRRRGLGAVGSPLVAALARRKRQPVWNVLREARAGLRPGAALPMPVHPLLTRDAQAYAARAVHPWVSDVPDLPIARRLQIAALANAQVLRNGVTRHRTVGDPLFPLLAQPVVELCLSIPVEVLAGGVQDRAFARRAFAGHVPPLILDRRSKGSLMSWFARLLAVSREALLPFLADGVLADAGLLDRAAVTRALDPGQLIWDPRPSEVLMAAAVEAWVRHWQGRMADSPRAQRWRTR